VLLWPDTFNNHFHPSTLVAAVQALEHGGCEVEIPRAALCCGRPLYDYGMLTLAKRQLRQTLESLKPEIRAGVPIVGLEPSCVSVFRDEMLDLLPSDEDAARLSRQTFTLGEFLVEQLDDYPFPKLTGRALLHGHCHHKAVLSMKGENDALREMGLELEIPDSGCCGMAGGFGFERDKYGVSVAIGEHVLLPAVRAADSQTLIVSDGFSCREQIRQCTDREGLHFAEVVQLGLHSEQFRSIAESPEHALHKTMPRELKSSTLPPAAIAAGAGALVAGGILLRSFAKRRSNARQAAARE
jgi:Fe-S oxidoreductase